jgi:hypothetical protein
MNAVDRGGPDPVRRRLEGRGCQRKRDGKKVGGEEGDWEDKPARRELIDTGPDKRFVRHGAAGKFKEPDDVGKSLSVDRRKRAKTKVSGQGDKGDR